MDEIYFNFNKEKSLETVLYLINRLEKATLHSIFKLMYFADTLHLARYGRFITGDSYVAMEYGPVPSATYDMSKNPPMDFSVQGYHLFAKRDAQLECFSESDLICLNHILAQYGSKSFGELTDASHDEAWQATPDNTRISIEAIAKMLKDEDLLDYLQNHY